MQTKNPPQEFTERCIVANFVEVFLAREGHNHIVGINYLEKMQIPHLSYIYGAMLAGVVPANAMMAFNADSEAATASTVIPTRSAP